MKLLQQEERPFRKGHDLETSRAAIIEVVVK